MRSTEVAGVFGALLVVLMDLEARTLPQMQISVMLYGSIWVSGAGSITNMDFGAEEGSMFEDLGEDKS